MTNEKLTELLKIAYRWGRNNGEGRSEKNFNDLLQTEAISQALRIHDVVGRSEQLKCDICKSGLIDYPEIDRRTCRCGALGYNVID